MMYAQTPSETSTPRPRVTTARFQAPTPRPADSRRDEFAEESFIQLEPPGLLRLSRLESDENILDRIRQEALQRVPNDQITFPDEPILSREQYYGRGKAWALRQVTAEANYVCYHKLFFEAKNSERYGWELGVLQPFVSAGVFFGDVALLPFHLATNPKQCCECSAGYCLPGDPVPLLIYPQEINLPNTAAEIAVIVALAAIFP
jgi:hypothetical protein